MPSKKLSKYTMLNLNKLITWIALTSFIFVSSNISLASTISTATNNLQIYKNERFGYQISFPKGWKVTKEISKLDEMNKIESSVTIYEKNRKYAITVSVDKNPPSVVLTDGAPVKKNIQLGGASTTAYIFPKQATPCLSAATVHDDCSSLYANVYYNGLWYRFYARSNATREINAVYKDILSSFQFIINKKSDTQKIKETKKDERLIGSLVKKMKKSADKIIKNEGVVSEAVYSAIIIGNPDSPLRMEYLNRVRLCNSGYTNSAFFPVGSQITCSDSFAPYAIKVTHTNSMDVTKYWCIDSSGAKRFRVTTNMSIAHDTNCDDDDLYQNTANEKIQKSSKPSCIITTNKKVYSPNEAIILNWSTKNATRASWGGFAGNSMVVYPPSEPTLQGSQSFTLNSHSGEKVVSLELLGNNDFAHGACEVKFTVTQ